MSFPFSDVSYVQLGSNIDGEDFNDQSGRSVSLSADGTIVAIGAPGNSTSSGHVRIYKRDVNKVAAVTDQNSPNFGPVGWTRLGQDIDGEAANDESGYSLSLSADGTTVAIGAHYNDGNGSNSGHVRVYKYLNNSWTQLGQDIDGEGSNDWSGRSVSLSSDGTIVAIGAMENNGKNYSDDWDYGHVRIYKYDPNKLTVDTCQNSVNFGPVGWTRLGQDIDGENRGNFSGESVSLSSDGKIVAIGAIYNNENGQISGHVRVYKYDVSKNVEVTDQNSTNFGPVGWTRLGQDIDGIAMYDGSGRSVSLSADGTIVAISAVGLTSPTGSFSGIVRVYKYQSGLWSKLGEDINGENAQDYSGFSVSLSADGTIVAIGGPQNDGNGSDSGHVRIYKYDANKLTAVTDQSDPNFGPVGWTRLGKDIDGEAPNNYTGVSVSLSADGTILAVGSIGNNGNTGSVRVYKLQIPTIEPTSNICFPAGTPINTDQGFIEIDKLNPSVNTIRGNKIETITKTITEDKYLICLEKDALAKNIPSEKTLITKNHKLFYNGKMLAAEELLKLNNDKIYKVKYNGEVLYNVLLENKHDKMIVNNLICETLDPKNGIAKMHNILKNKSYNEISKWEFINEYNNLAKKERTFVK